MRIFKTKPFGRFARRESIDDAHLVEAIERAEKRLIDAILGGGLVKQRIARPGKGRSGGYRALIAYRKGKRAIFLSGFAKNERANIDDDDVASLKDIAEGWLSASGARVKHELEVGNLKEIER